LTRLYGRLTLFQSRAEQSRAEQSRAEQSRAEQSRAEQSRAEQSRTSSDTFERRNGEAESISSDSFGRESAGAGQSSADLFGDKNETEQDNFSDCSGGINFATTENVFIEGDNLDALKLLQETYLNKIKLIYIDPPYNTGQDFIYKDKRIADEGEYLEDSDYIDEDGNYLVANPASNGRFHSDWLSFIYPRLKLARNLLRDDGVIFISIDDNEQANLKKLCDEIFGAENFIGCIGWESKTKSQNTSSAYNKLQPRIEYILCYTKADCRRFNLRIKGQKTYPEADEYGVYREYPLELMNAGGVRGRESMIYEIEGIFPPKGKQWKLGQAQVATYRDSGNLFIRDEKIIIKMRPEFERSEIAEPFWAFFSKDIGTAESAKKDLNILMEVGNIFDTVKPVELIKRLIFHAATEDSIILDFFAGSGTTAQAVMQLNAEDGGKRKFILVQLPEEVDDKSEAAKAGFKNIAEICKERIRRAGQMITSGKYSDGRSVKDWQPPKNADLDIGFRVFKIDSSNMREDYYRLPQETDQAALTEKADNIKPGRSAEDLLFQLFLEWGVPLSARIEKTEIDGRQVFFVNKAEFEGIQTDMIACFERNLGESLLIKLAQLKPLRAVFRDHGFVTDSMRENVDGIFKQIAPETELKVI